MPSKKGGTRVRSAVSGQFVKKSKATSNPRETVKEKVKPRKK